MKQILRETWRINPWLVGLICFLFQTTVANRILVYSHSRPPEAYRAPEKVSQRVLLADFQLWGGICLLGMTFWRRSRESTLGGESA